jgi:hypothetical protein
MQCSKKQQEGYLVSKVTSLQSSDFRGHQQGSIAAEPLINFVGSWYGRSALLTTIFFILIFFLED